MGGGASATPHQLTAVSGRLLQAGFHRHPPELTVQVHMRERTTSFPCPPFFFIANIYILSQAALIYTGPDPVSTYHPHPTLCSQALPVFPPSRLHSPSIPPQWPRSYKTYIKLLLSLCPEPCQQPNKNNPRAASHSRVQKTPRKSRNPTWKKCREAPAVISPKHEDKEEK